MCICTYIYVYPYILLYKCISYKYLHRFSESLNTVKDVAEKSISEDYDSLIQNTASSVKSDMKSDFSNYGHHMWDLK